MVQPGSGTIIEPKKTLSVISFNFQAKPTSAITLIPEKNLLQVSSGLITFRYRSENPFDLLHHGSLVLKFQQVICRKESLRANS